MKQLEWYAITKDFNSHKIIQINIIRNDLIEGIKKGIKKKQITNKEELKEYIDKDLMYHYWSKSEYEIAVTGLFDTNLENAIKIDIYYQLKPNLDRIVEYINTELKLNL